MCGICGFVVRGQDPSDGVLRAMMAKLRHRGPDASGSEVFAISGGPGPARVALGHQRLSILDLSDRGRQPMRTADGRYTIIYNGEIYNYLELRQDLEAKGVRFVSDTDTEVLLQAYATWGPDALDRLNGMFAFAIWDAERQELFCARDRFGIKPFYYWCDHQHFVFGSEPSALFAHPAVPRRPNDRAVYDYLALKLLDHTSETFYEDVWSLPAAHFMVVRPGEKPVPKRWWDLQPASDVSTSEAEFAASARRLGELLQDSVRLRLRSDVAVGTCLSGGLDSSAIVLLINHLMLEGGIDRSNIGERQKTFTAAFEDARFDESRYAQMVVDRAGAAASRTYPTGRELWKDLPRVIELMGEPFHSTSQYSQYRVMKLVGEHGVKVTLDGQGADEMLAGYPGYYGVLMTTLARRGAASHLLHEFRAAAEMGGRGRGMLELGARLGYGLVPVGLKLAGRRVANRLNPRFTPEGRLEEFIQPDFAATYRDRFRAAVESQNSLYGDFPARLYKDFFHNGLPSLLRYEDRNSMAFSIEARTPFLDYRLVEHIFASPMLARIRDGWSKRGLRDAMDGTLPKEIQWRKDKKGFVTPEALWLREGRSQVVEMLSGRLKLENYLQTDALRTSVDKLISNSDSGSYYTDMFRWVCLEMWLRTF